MILSNDVAYSPQLAKGLLTQSFRRADCQTLTQTMLVPKRDFLLQEAASLEIPSSFEIRSNLNVDRPREKKGDLSQSGPVQPFHN